MTAVRRLRPREDDGFTLIELLVTMSIAVILLIAILNASDIFATTTRRASDTTAAQDAARQQVRDLVAFARQGRVASGQTTPVPTQWVPSRSDLTIAAFVTGPGQASSDDEPGWIRYCAVTSGDQVSLIAGVRVGDTYAAPGPCSATDTTNGWSYTTLLPGTLRDPATLFNFTSATCVGATCLPPGAAVEAVGIRLAVSGSRDDTQATSIVRDAVSFRNRSSS